MAHLSWHAYVRSQCTCHGTQPSPVAASISAACSTVRIARQLPPRRPTAISAHSPRPLPRRTGEGAEPRPTSLSAVDAGCAATAPAVGVVPGDLLERAVPHQLWLHVLLVLLVTRHLLVCVRALTVLHSP